MDLAESYYAVADLVLKVLGAGGVITIVAYIVKISRWTGGIEAKVVDGFQANHADHIELKADSRETRDRTRSLESQVAVGVLPEAKRRLDKHEDQIEALRHDFDVKHPSGE